MGGAMFADVVFFLFLFQGWSLGSPTESASIAVSSATFAARACARAAVISFSRSAWQACLPSGVRREIDGPQTENPIFWILLACSWSVKSGSWIMKPFSRLAVASSLWFPRPPWIEYD